jgi:hypothetical protein
LPFANNSPEKYEVGHLSIKDLARMAVPELVCEVVYAWFGLIMRNSCLAVRSVMMVCCRMRGA